MYLCMLHGPAKGWVRTILDKATGKRLAVCKALRANGSACKRPMYFEPI